MAAKDSGWGMQYDPISPPPVYDPIPMFLRQWLQDLRVCFTAPSWEHVLVLIMGAILVCIPRDLNTHSTNT
jgi:hypothetical protein